MVKKNPRYTEQENLQTKTIYYFIDEEENKKIKAKEVFKRDEREIHYPFGRDYEQKYPHIKQIEYIGFNGKLPRGISSSESRGLGFTKTLSPVIYFLDDSFKLSKVTLVKKGKDSLNTNNHELTLTADTLDKIFTVFSNLFDRHRDETKNLAVNTLARYFPAYIKTSGAKYAKNTVHSFLESVSEHAAEFSDLDIKTLLDALDKASENREVIEAQTLIKTKEVIEEHYIEDVLKQYKDLLSQKTETKTLENKWHDFLKIHSWIFSYILSLPVILHENEAYVGGKKVSNKNGKVTDFLIKNDLTNNVAFVEIKTHKTEIIKGGGAYRGEDVFPVSVDLTGAINQVLNQRDNFQKEFWQLKGKSKADFQSFNSKCVVLAGTIADLKEAELDSFELFRSNSKDVLIMTFDELLSRIESLQVLMKQRTGSD